MQCVQKNEIELARAARSMKQDWASLVSQYKIVHKRYNNAQTIYRCS